MGLPHLRFAKVSRRTVRRVAEEPAIERVDDEEERARRKIGRPSTAEHFSRFEGVPLCAVFDRRKMEALHWGKDS
jgi:hypothetical protein